MIKIAKITGLSAEEAFASLAPVQLACCNWPEQYPYSPQVAFRMYHTGKRLMLRFDVAERHTAAKVTKDNGEVWTDSCVEFFIAPDNSMYYNFETNCIGTMLLGARKSRDEAEHASAEVLSHIGRETSLPKGEAIELAEGDNRWSLTLSIPPTALFKHDISDWSGVGARMNLYKCGDNLPVPHFLSWQPIDTPAPDFHRPEFFADVIFEE
jgi:hypothetical protein